MFAADDVTAAWLPGTTLDVVEVKGLPMPRKCFVYDTPGVRHDHQLSSLVNPAEVSRQAFKINSGHRWANSQHPSHQVVVFDCSSQV